jgi:hypothetical protein
MELVIDGLHKIRRTTYHARTISDISIDKRDGAGGRDASYVFTFPPIDNPLDGWNKKMEVYLCKYPTPDEKYELFVMGLHGVTCHYLELEEIKDIIVFQVHIISTMNKAKEYWKSLN